MIYSKSSIERFFWLRRFKRQLWQFLKGKKEERNKSLVIDAYSESGTRDLQYYFDETLRRDSIVDDQVRISSHKEIKDHHISIIDKFIDGDNTVRVLEIGAGTSINMYLLNKQFPRIEFHGVDIVPERVATGIEYFVERYGFSPNTIIGDATNLPFPDAYFDLVYSMHCFEQMENYLEKSVLEARRVCKSTMVFLEPDWKSSNLAQKLFLINNDYLRSIDRCLRQFGPRYSHERVSTYHNPLNRTGLFVVDCT